jgi:hypothetical protein
LRPSSLGASTPLKVTVRVDWLEALFFVINARDHLPSVIQVLIIPRS